MILQCILGLGEGEHQGRKDIWLNLNFSLLWIPTNGLACGNRNETFQEIICDFSTERMEILDFRSKFRYFCFRGAL